MAFVSSSVLLPLSIVIILSLITLIWGPFYTRHKANPRVIKDKMMMMILK